MSEVRLLPLWLRQLLRGVLDSAFDVYATKSYSQDGEDMILRRIFGRKSDGFYVDVGAHHPRRYSNTNFFYRSGWSGINIEPNPDAIRIFQRARPRDINLQLGVSDQSGSLNYHQFDEPALNTFDEELAQSRLAKTSYKLKKIVPVRVETLGEILAQHLPANQEVDFLSIDVEGLDLKVLRSNDWARFRPKYVVVEALGVSLEEIKEADAYRFMVAQGYELFAKTFNTLMFRRLR